MGSRTAFLARAVQGGSPQSSALCSSRNNRGLRAPGGLLRSPTETGKPRFAVWPPLPDYSPLLKRYGQNSFAIASSKRVRMPSEIEGEGRARRPRIALIQLRDGFRFGPGR